MSLFSDMIEEKMKVFMDDFSVFGESFDSCSLNLEMVLKRCEETYLRLNWEKCHFMVTKGIVLCHKVSKKGLEVDKAKTSVIEQLPPPSNVKAVRSFLGHASFYHRFIKDFSKITKPLCQLLEKDTPFNFDQDCSKSFKELKRQLISTPIIIAPDLLLPFEVMCDASDYAVGAVLEQRKENVFHPIYYARPFRVISVAPSGAVEVKDERTGDCFKVNGQRLKHYHGEVDRPKMVYYLFTPS
ncbi:uncharacterized protein LOC114713635 [Neltuma alba]|uniref:uncharacterized protein LOC114713635 n=1 Tax=Neltuma alba TaxID=207710 RepID=UPI0010A2D221|nr:uncharacterized protein LOC114713635 [Prosopis alba]